MSDDIVRLLARAMWEYSRTDEDCEWPDKPFANLHKDVQRILYDQVHAQLAALDAAGLQIVPK